MKKLLFVFFVLAVVMGSTSLHAQNFFLTDDDEREIPLFPSGSEEGGMCNIRFVSGLYGQ